MNFFPLLLPPLPSLTSSLLFALFSFPSPPYLPPVFHSTVITHTSSMVSPSPLPHIAVHQICLGTSREPCKLQTSYIPHFQSDLRKMPSIHRPLLRRRHPHISQDSTVAMEKKLMLVCWTRSSLFTRKWPQLRTLLAPGNLLPGVVMICSSRMLILAMVRKLIIVSEGGQQTKGEVML